MPHGITNMVTQENVSSYLQLTQVNIIIIGYKILPLF